MSANPAAYQDFQRQLGGGTTGNMGLSNYSGFSGTQQTRIKSEFASSQKGGAQDMRAENAAITSKRPSLMQNLNSQRPPKPYVNEDNAEVMKSTRSFLAKTQEEMWADFNGHFRNPDRPAVKVNHHDFLDGSFLTKLREQQSRKTFFS